MARRFLLRSAEILSGSTVFTNTGSLNAGVADYVDGSVTHDTSQAKYFTSSIDFASGTGGYIWFDFDASPAAGGDWTVEAWAWFYWDDFDGAAVISNSTNATTGFWIRQTLANNGLEFMHNGSTIASPNIPTNQWVHLAAVRSGTTITFYVNGTSAGTIDDTGGTGYDATALGLYLGYSNTAGYNWEGRLDEVAIHDTAVYTANFTPPIAPAEAVPCIGQHNAGATTALLANPVSYSVFDFSDILADTPLRFELDVVDSLQAVTTVPMSKWQATLSDGGYNYVQASVPGITSTLETLLNDAVSFTIYRVGTLTTGAPVRSAMASGNVTRLSFSRGTSNYTAVVSGSGNVGLGGGANQAITVSGVRSMTISTDGTRVRCNVDWFIKAGASVTAEGVQFLADYVTFYVLGNDAYMDVGERV